MVEGVYPGRAAGSFKLGEAVAGAPADFTRICYRTDPPVDLAYLHPLQLLVLGLEGVKTCEIVNPAQALFAANEKTLAAMLDGLLPPTMVASRWEDFLPFGRGEGRTVLKPLHEAQSHGVELLEWHHEEAQRDAREKIRAATEDFQKPVLLQRYLEGVGQGEQRLWFLNGKLLAHARKIPRAGEFRINMDQGGTIAVSELSSAEKKAASRIGKLLRSRKIRMAAVDLIEGWVTDFNFTSPGLLAQMESLLGENLARPVMESLVLPYS